MDDQQRLEEARMAERRARYALRAQQVEESKRFATAAERVAWYAAMGWPKVGEATSIPPEDYKGGKV